MELSILDNLCPKLPRTPSVLFNDSVSSLLAYNKLICLIANVSYLFRPKGLLHVTLIQESKRRKKLLRLEVEYTFSRKLLQYQSSK